MSGLGKVYPAFAKRDPAPAIGIRTFNLLSRHGSDFLLVPSIVFIRSSILCIIGLELTSLAFSTASKCAPESSAPCRPM